MTASAAPVVLPPPVDLLSLSFAAPPHRLRQDAVIGLCRKLYGDRPAFFARMEQAYRNAGIEERRSCVPLDWYGEPHGWVERTGLYAEHGLALVEAAAEEALARAGLAAGQVDAVVAVSSTGVLTPTLDAHLLNRLGLRSDIMRLPVFGLGCVGGVTGLARAADLARAHPGRNVLYVVLELCALTFRPQDASKANVIASALFGDGCAAAVLRAGGDEAGGVGVGGGVARIEASADHTWSDSLDVMGWRVEEDGLGVIFSRDIPNLVGERLKPVAAAFLAAHGLGFGDLAGIVAHPGGTKVLEAYERTLGLGPDALAHARAVLRDYGNMSAVTVLAVLQRSLEAEEVGRRLMLALGPGFTAGLMLIDLGPDRAGR